jgi:hypothetical protein
LTAAQTTGLPHGLLIRPPAWLTWCLLIGIIGLVLMFSSKRPPPPPQPAVSAPILEAPRPSVPKAAPAAPLPTTTVSKEKPAKEALPDPNAKKPSTARSRVLFASARNLDKADKKGGAIYFYRQVVMECRGTPESDQAIIRLQALGGTVPELAESIPPKEGDPFTPPKGRPPRHYASSEAARQQFDQMLSQAMQSAMNESSGQGMPRGAPGTGAASSHRCGAATRDGTPCQNLVQGAGFCYLHR